MATRFCIADAVVDRTIKTLLVMETRDSFSVYRQEGASAPKQMQSRLNRQTAAATWAEVLVARFSALMGADDAARLAERRISVLLH